MNYHFLETESEFELKPRSIRRLTIRQSGKWEKVVDDQICYSISCVEKKIIWLEIIASTYCHSANSVLFLLFFVVKF